MVESELAPPRHSPLQDYAERFAAASTTTAIVVRERPFLAMLDLRIAAEDPASESSHGRQTSVGSAVDRCAEVLGLEIPTNAGTATGDAQRCVLWLGPRWWLVVGPPGTESQTQQELHAALGSTPGSVVDVSCWRTSLEVSGTHARALLRTGCSIDLHPREFPQRSCAQTLLARAPTIIARLPPTSRGTSATQSESEPTYQVFPRTSYASYLADWLLDAMTGLQRDLDR